MSKKNFKKWTPDEDKILKRYYGKISSLDISRLYLSNRNRNSIKGRAAYLSLNGNRDKLRFEYNSLPENLLLPNHLRYCSKCCQIKLLDDFIVGNTLHSRCKKCRYKTKQQWHKINKEKENKKQSQRVLRMKEQIFNHYGNQCACCGEDNIKFLTIEHILGASHSSYNTKYGKKGQRINGYCLYKWIIDNNYPETIELLCWNCNLGRYHNNGVCPHQE